MKTHLLRLPNVSIQLSKFYNKFLLFVVEKEDQVALKCRGCPWQTTHEDLYDFFRDFKIVEKSVQLGKGADGRNNGFAAVLFESADEAVKAKDELDGKYIGSRYVNLYPMNYGDYMRFNAGGNGGGGSRAPKEDVALTGKVNDGNKDRAICIRGLPFRVKVEEIIEFFEGYGKLAEDAVFIEEEAGRRTGSGLVIFENEDIAQDAKDAL